MEEGEGAGGLIKDLMNALGSSNIGEIDLGDILGNAIKNVPPHTKEDNHMRMCMDMLHRMKIFDKVSDDKKVTEFIKNSLAEEGQNDSKRLMAYLLKCIVDEKCKGAIISIRKLIKQDISASAIG